jgi:epoxyqueuosine reductase
VIPQIQTITQSIKEQAFGLGFYHIGIAKAQPMEEEDRRLEAWLNQGYHGQMSYMANHYEKRVDPTKLVPGAKSVISLAYNYFTTEKQTDSAAPKFSTYAFGKDYHFVVKEKMQQLYEQIQLLVGSEINGRYFVDSAPVLERDWARRAGVGWIGKNTLLIHPKKGSFFFLGEIILDLEMVYDTPIKDYCGTCRKCIEACPTEAISPQGYVMDGSKCISYLTIELKEAIPTEFKGKMEGWVFGCDICQDVCPWNRFSIKHNEPAFQPKESFLQMEAEEWFDLTSETFSQLFSKSAVKRTKYAGLKRNIRFTQQ